MAVVIRVRFKVVLSVKDVFFRVFEVEVVFWGGREDFLKSL